MLSLMLVFKVPAQIMQDTYNLVVIATYFIILEDSKFDLLLLMLGFLWCGVVLLLALLTTTT